MPARKPLWKRGKELAEKTAPAALEDIDRDTDPNYREVFMAYHLYRMYVAGYRRAKREAR